MKLLRPGEFTSSEQLTNIIDAKAPKMESIQLQSTSDTVPAIKETRRGLSLWQKAGVLGLSALTAFGIGAKSADALNIGEAPAPNSVEDSYQGEDTTERQAPSSQETKQEETSEGNSRTGGEPTPGKSE